MGATIRDIILNYDSLDDFENDIIAIGNKPWYELEENKNEELRSLFDEEEDNDIQMLQKKKKCNGRIYTKHSF